MAPEIYHADADRVPAYAGPEGNHTRKAARPWGGGSGRRIPLNLMRGPVTA
jgi:hypothetical protein